MRRGKGSYQVVPVVDTEEGIVSIRTGEDKVLYLLDETKPNSESNPYIVETANQMYMLIRMLSTDSAGNNIATVAGNYFKVADGIKAFYINGGEKLAAMNSAADVKNYFETTTDSISKAWTGSRFAGHFDGNGVEVYGIRSDDSYAGLFPMVTGNVSIKNVIVKNSYFKSGAAGGIIGATDNDNATVTIENCAVINNYIESTNANNGAASLVCQSFGCAIQAKDILVYGNDFVSKSTASYGAVSYGWSTTSQFTNMVTIGYAPYRVNGNNASGGNGNASHHYCKSEIFSNVYTDQEAASSYQVTSGITEITYTADQVKQIAVDDIKGAAAQTNMPALDWNTNTNPDGVWFVGKSGEYPSLLKGFSLEVADASNTALDLLAVNIEYASSGNFNLNFHYAPTAANAVLYVPSAQSATGFQKIETSTASPFAGSALPEGAKMFTVSNLSAKDIDILWLPTIIAEDDEIMYGKTEQISVEDYATAVVEGKASYPNSTTDEQKTADKNVAAALINYGYAAKDAMASTTAPSEGIVSEYTGEEKEISLLDPSQANSESNPYIIANANQMYNFMVGNSTSGGVAIDTAGKYFKVADGIKAFYMNGGATVAAMTTPE